MIEYKVAYSLGVIKGIIESDYELNSSTANKKSQQLKEHLDYLQSILVEPILLTMDTSLAQMQKISEGAI